jgi:transcriptional regulator with XRE-family HTH domain
MPRTNSSSITQIVAGEEIRSVRLAQGLTQSEVARRLDASPAYVSAIEAGSENLTLGSLARIAAALDRGFEVAFPAVKDSTRTIDEDLAAIAAERGSSKADGVGASA